MSDFLITNENNNTFHDRLKKFIDSHDVKYFFYNGGYFSSYPLRKLSNEFEKFHQIVILVGERVYFDFIKIINNDNLSAEESKIRNWYLSGKLKIKVPIEADHSKNYIIQYREHNTDKFIAFSGSANFTNTGFGYSNKGESTWQKEDESEIKELLYVNFSNKIDKSVDIQTALKENILCKKCGGRIINGYCEECGKIKRSKKTKSKHKYYSNYNAGPASIPINGGNPTAHIDQYEQIDNLDTYVEQDNHQANKGKKRLSYFNKFTVIMAIFIFIYAVFHYFHNTNDRKIYNSKNIGKSIPKKIAQKIRNIKHQDDQYEYNNKIFYKKTSIKPANNPLNASPFQQFNKFFRNAKPTITLIMPIHDKNIQYTIFSHLYSFADNIRRGQTEIFRLRFNGLIPSDSAKIRIVSEIQGNKVNDINVSYVKMDSSGKYNLSLPVKIPNNFPIGRYNFSYIINRLMYSRYAYFKVE